MIDMKSSSRVFPLMAASLATMRVMGNNDHLYFRSLPTFWSDFDNKALHHIESALYGGIYGLGKSTWNTVVITNILANIDVISERSYFEHSLGRAALNSLSYITSNLLVEAELAIESLYSNAEKKIGNVSSFFNALRGNIPARNVLSTVAQASKGQSFQFFLRSLKPSIWKSDTNKGDTKAPKGILRLPHSVSNFQETYNATWNQQNILGSAQKIHRYQYTDRSINLTLELYSHSLVELRYNIWRLNWLSEHLYGKLSNFIRNEENIVSNPIQNVDATTAPKNARFSQTVEYKEYPFMRLTFGTVLVEVPCYISNMTINYHMDAPWEIGDDLLNRLNGEKNLQWPHWITVTLTFNVLYDTLDPTSKSFYKQDGTKKENSNSLQDLASGNILKQLDYIEWK